MFRISHRLIWGYLVALALLSALLTANNVWWLFFSQGAVLVDGQQQAEMERKLQRLQECLLREQKTSFPIVTPTSSPREYNNLRLTWNRANQHLQYPGAIALPPCAQDVTTLVTCAIQQEFFLCARNGKHSYDATSSICPGGILVDVSRLTTIHQLQEEPHNVLSLGAGLTLGQVAVALVKNYNLTLPMGSCPTVGITGLTLNGGQGPLTRWLGLTSDFLTAIELVDATGRLVRATDEKDADFLWLARGGGGSVGFHFPGIITRLEFSNLEPVLPNAKTWTRLRIDYPASDDSAISLLHDWQHFHAEHNDLILLRLTIEPWLLFEKNRRTKEYQPSAFVLVYMYGPDEVHQTLMERLLPTIKSFGHGGKLRYVQRLDDLELKRKLGGVRTMKQLTSGSSGHDVGKTWFGQSAVINGLLDPRRSSLAFRKVVENIFHSRPHTRRYAEFKPLGGAMSTNFGKTETAFWHRESSWWVLVNSFFVSSMKQDSALNSSKPQLDDWKRQFRCEHALFVKELGKTYSGSYAGYVDHSRCNACDLQQYFGENRERMIDVKNKRDPSNRFRMFLP